MNNKDEALTYEELTALCRKQEEYIKELEGKTPSETEKCEVRKPTYDELISHNMRLSDKNREQEETIQALLYSLQKINIERLVNEDESRHFKEMWGKEYERANKLYDEWEKLK